MVERANRPITLDRKNHLFASSEGGAARCGIVASFARGVMNDETAARAAISSAWSNGQTEHHIARLKLVRCQMYGRGNPTCFRPD